MHDRTTPEQAEINRGRNNYGTFSKVENTTPPNDDYDVYTSMARGGMVHDTSQSHYEQSALVSVVTGAMTGAFAVWLGHEKNDYDYMGISVDCVLLTDNALTKRYNGLIKRMSV